MHAAAAYQLVGIDHREVALTLLWRSLEDAEGTRFHGIVDLLARQPQGDQITMATKEFRRGVLPSRQGFEVGRVHGSRQGEGPENAGRR